MSKKTSKQSSVVGWCRGGGPTPAAIAPQTQSSAWNSRLRVGSAAAALAFAVAGSCVCIIYLLLLVFISLGPTRGGGGGGGGGGSLDFQGIPRLWYLCGKHGCPTNKDKDGHVIAPPYGGGDTWGSGWEAREDATNLSHIVFGIASSSRSWPRRKEYIKLWWRGGGGGGGGGGGREEEEEMRGYVWVDEEIRGHQNRCVGDMFPPLRVSADTSQFEYTSTSGSRAAIRISRIVSETVGLVGRDPRVRWLVMGDDDTLFVPENLVTALRKFDHREMYYIGSTSESHLQNVAHFSYNMAYGGGGFAISYPLALALHAMQDGCLARYPALIGSDDRIQACVAELGVPLTRHPGFHQFDIYGNLFGLLAAHPVAPAISLHHLDIVDPIFPNMTKLGALTHLKRAMDADPAYFLQQSICYDKERHWSISVSWGFAIQIYRGIFTPRELELPSRTYYNWHRKADYTAFAFNTRPFFRHPCQRPFIFYMHNITSFRMNREVWMESHYIKEVMSPLECKWKMVSPQTLHTIKVVKRKEDNIWSKGPRRKCCQMMKSGPSFLELGVRDCEDGEIASI